MYERFKCVKRVHSLNYFNGTVFLININAVIKAVPVSTPYCLPFLLATANQMRPLGEALYKSRVYRINNCVYEHHKQQDHPMENIEKILNYYEVIVTCEQSSCMNLCQVVTFKKRNNLGPFLTQFMSSTIGLNNYISNVQARCCCSYSSQSKSLKLNVTFVCREGDLSS